MDDPPKKCVIECVAQQPPAGDCIPICSYATLPPLPPIILSPPTKHHHSSLSLPLKVSLLILVLTFSFFLLYTLYKFYTVWYRSRRRRSPPSPALAPGNQETHDEFLDHDAVDHPIWYIRTIGLQPSVISAITVVKYSKGDGLIEGTDCSVCLSDFQEDETLRLLPKCNHAFHISCIDTWLRSHTNCPLCRAAIVRNSTTRDDSEEAQVAISIPEEVGREERPGEELRTEEEDVNAIIKGDAVGGSGGSDFLIMRRSVSLNDYAACRIRSDVLHNSNNHYHSDRHQLQIQSVDGISTVDPDRGRD